MAIKREPDDTASTKYSKTRQDKTKGSETEAERRSRKQTKKSSIGKQPILLYFILCTGV